MLLDPGDDAADESADARLGLVEGRAGPLFAEALAPGEQRAGLLGRGRLAAQHRRGAMQRLDREAFLGGAAADGVLVQQRLRRAGRLDGAMLQGIRGLQEGVRRLPLFRDIRDLHQAA
ncbi:hypothetical protein L0B80_13155 [Ralstonia solanacearum]|nr:hypothetical protein [Ralstonia solanacearum]